jgi:predicted GTPase
MRILIVGTAGRDFHVFNTIYRDDPTRVVVAFTAADLPLGQQGHYPACLAGARYPDGIPILPEAELSRVITDHGVDTVVFAYSEIGCGEIASLAAQVLAAGADFHLVNPRRSMLAGSRPVIAVTAARSGAGKSPAVRYLAELLSSWNQRVAVVRHPVRVQSFLPDREHAVAVLDDALVDACAAPTREPFESVPGATVFSGLDFQAILDAAQAEADVILWDGAGSDLPFLEPTLHLVVIDPLRADEASDYFPGEVGLRLADAVLVSKCDTATPDQIALVERAVRKVNRRAAVLTADSPVLVEDADVVAGRTVVVVEEELTLSLGALRPGAGTAAAHQAGAAGIISPLPQAVGSLVAVYAAHPEAQSVLPAMGYGPEELADLRATLEATPSEAVIDATRVDLAGLLGLSRPVARAAYGMRPHDPQRLAELVRAALGPARPRL